MRYKELRMRIPPTTHKALKELAEARGCTLGQAVTALVTQVQEAPVRGQAEVEARLEHLQDMIEQLVGALQQQGQIPEAFRTAKGKRGLLTRLLYKDNGY